MCLISTLRARFTTCAASWTAPAATSCTGRSAADRGIVGEALQFGSPSQCDWLPGASGQTRRARRSHLCGARSQTRRCSPVAPTAPQPQDGGHWTGTPCHSRLTVPGEAEAGSAGKQPCQGITWWAHRHDGNGACRYTLTLRLTSSDDRPQCLKNPTNHKAIPLYLGNPGGPPFHAEPGHPYEASTLIRTRPLWDTSTLFGAGLTQYETGVR